MIYCFNEQQRRHAPFLPKPICGALCLCLRPLEMREKWQLVEHEDLYMCFGEGLQMLWEMNEMVTCCAEKM